MILTWSLRYLHFIRILLDWILKYLPPSFISNFVDSKIRYRISENHAIPQSHVTRFMGFQILATFLLIGTFLSTQIRFRSYKNSQRKLSYHSTRSDSFHDDHLLVSTWVILLSDPGSMECKNAIWTLEKMRYLTLWSPIGRNTSNKVMIW